MRGGIPVNEMADRSRDAMQQSRHRYSVLMLAGVGVFLILVLAFALQRRQRMYSRWEPGDHGYRRTNLVRDTGGDILLFDEKMNMSVMLLPGDGGCSSFGFSATDTQSTVSCANGKCWTWTHGENILVVGGRDGRVCVLDVQEGYAARIREELPYPQGVYEGDLTELLLRCCRNGDSSPIRNALAGREPGI